MEGENSKRGDLDNLSDEEFIKQWKNNEFLHEKIEKLDLIEDEINKTLDKIKHKEEHVGFWGKLKVKFRKDKKKEVVIIPLPLPEKKTESPDNLKMVLECRKNMAQNELIIFELKEKIKEMEINQRILPQLLEKSQALEEIKMLQEQLNIRKGQLNI